MISSVPIYDYRCDHCGHAFSVVLSFADKAVEVCPSCGKRPRKLMVAPAVVFKGSGWYKTDSRTTPKSDGDGASGAKVDSKSGATADTKPAADAPKPAADAPKPAADGAASPKTPAKAPAKTEAAS